MKVQTNIKAGREVKISAYAKRHDSIFDLCFQNVIHEKRNVTCFDFAEFTDLKTEYENGKELSVC